MKHTAWLTVTGHPPLTAPLCSPLSRGIASEDGGLLPWLGCPASMGLAGSTAEQEAVCWLPKYA